MKTTAHTGSFSQRSHTVSKEVPSKPAYRVVIAYDEFASGRRAVETCHRLISAFKDDFTVLVKVWSFAVLRNTAANLTAASDAAQAQMVMIATSSGELPSAVKKWVEGWLVWSGGRGGMLLALVHAGAAKENCCPIENYLRSAAARGGIEFLLEKTDGAGESGLFCPR